MTKLLKSAWAWLVAKLSALWQKSVVVAMYVFASSVFAVKKVLDVDLLKKFGFSALAATALAIGAAMLGTIAWVGVPMSIVIDTLFLSVTFDAVHYLYAFGKQMLNRQAWRDAFFEANRQHRVNGMHDVNKAAFG